MPWLRTVAHLSPLARNVLKSKGCMNYNPVSSLFYLNVICHNNPEDRYKQTGWGCSGDVGMVVSLQTLLFLWSRLTHICVSLCFPPPYFLLAWVYSSCMFHWPLKANHLSSPFASWRVRDQAKCQCSGFSPSSFIHMQCLLFRALYNRCGRGCVAT